MTSRLERLRALLQRDTAREIGQAVVLPFVLHRLLLACAVYFGATLIGVYGGWRALPGVPLLDAWIRWDSFYYLVIATDGYGSFTWRTPNPFFPLYAWLSRIVGFVVPLPIAALLVANGAALVALTLLFVHVKRTDGVERANRAVRIAILFPTSFFLSAAYSESTYLALLLGAVVAWEHRRQVVAAGCVALACLCRPVAPIALTVPFAVGWLITCLSRLRSPPCGRTDRRFRDVPWFVAGALVGVPLLLLTYKLSTGDPLAFLHAPQVSSLGSHSEVAHQAGALAVLWDEGWGQNLMRRLLNLSAIALVLATTVHFVRRKSWELGLIAALSLAVPLYFQKTLIDASSMARYALAAFPIFIALARWAPDGRRAMVVDQAFLMFQTLLAALFGASRWVE